MDCEPLVVLEPDVPAPTTGRVVVPEDWPPETVLFEPSALIALPVTVTGAVIGATSWLPPRTDCEPLVVLEPDVPCRGPLDLPRL